MTWATRALDALDDERRQITIRVVDNDEIRALNREFRNKDNPTNVLSFPFEPIPGVEEDVLGDIVISAPVVLAEASEQDKSPEAHWAHMLIHGILHLGGYDHMTEIEAITMETREVQLLSALGFPNPYNNENC